MRARLSRVPDAVQRVTKWSGAPLIRDRHRLERSRVCSAPLRAALRPGHETAAAARFGETNPTVILAKRTQGFIWGRPRESGDP
jgi:hypothetical protein